MAIDILRADSACVTPAPGADAHAIPFDPSNPAHQRAWESILNMGRVRAALRAKEAEKADEVKSEPAMPSHALFYACRGAKAAWELVMYAPEFIDSDVPDEIKNPLSDALNAYLLTPSDDLRDLVRKLKVFRHEQIHDGWFKAQEIVEAN